ncbi:hypothetical protein B0H11DRAFT_2231465 [Mycena galericulata]|nr:hypothetical protein B0H11DRAFT_2231465 [Mycena galericulata]
MVGPLENESASRMVIVSLLFTTLLAAQPGFDRPRFRYRSIRDVTSLCPDNTFLFGEAGSDRLCFRLPSCFFNDRANPNFVGSARDFVEKCFRDIRASASQVQPGEQLLLLLIGHGQIMMETGEFLLCVTTRSGRRGQAWLPKHRLETAVEHCAGQVTLICNSCNSGALYSPKWRLVCAAGPTELADALNSAPANVRESAFSLAEVRRARDLVPMLSPRSEKKPVGIVEEDMVHGSNEIYHSKGCSSMVTLIPIWDRIDFARTQLHILTPPFSLIPKSYRRDRQDDELCKRFMHYPGSLEDGEIVDLCISLRTRHIHSAVVQLASIRLGWCSTSIMTPFLSLKDAEPGERMIRDMVEEGFLVHEFMLRLLAYFDAISCHSDRASVRWLTKVWDGKGRPKVSPEEFENVMEEAVDEAARMILVPAS